MRVQGHPRAQEEPELDLRLGLVRRVTVNDQHGVVVQAGAEAVAGHEGVDECVAKLGRTDPHAERRQGVSHCSPIIWESRGGRTAQTAG